MGAKEPSWAATELRDLITERLALCICKVGTIKCTSQSGHDDCHRDIYQNTRHRAWHIEVFAK